MAPPPASPPSSPPSELGEISPRRRPLLRRWRRSIELEVMMGEGFRRILLQRFEPMARGTVRQELENILHNYITPIPRQLVGGAQHARYHLNFQNKICNPLYTTGKIEEEAGSDVEIALLDNDKKAVVTSGPLSSIKVKIVVLNGDFNNDDRETWSEEEFSRGIALPRDSKGPLLKGEQFIKLNNGIGSLRNIAFTDNSRSQKTGTFRLGVRYAQSAPNGERIQEGITEPFRVKEHRVEWSQKHHPPSLDDEVWRLAYIRKDGKFHESLQRLGIRTVQDFLRSYNLDEGKLRNILGSRCSWKEIVKHARECDPGDRLYSYSMRENSTVVPVVLFFNSIYCLVGLKFGDCYTTFDNLDTSQQASVESWKNLAYRNINDMRFDHIMINGHPMPLFPSDVTSVPGPSSLPLHISNFQRRNSDSAGGASLDLFIKDTSIDLDNHQTEQYTSFVQRRNRTLEMGGSSFINAPTTIAPNSEFPDLPVAHFTSEACFWTQPDSLGIESLEQPRPTGKEVSFERENSQVFWEAALTADTFSPQIFERLQANCGASYEQTTPVCSQNQVELSPFVESLRVQSIFSRPNSFDRSFIEQLIQTPINNLPASSGGETSSSTVPLSSPRRWFKLLAPIKWVQFTKKRRARISAHQTFVATV